MLQILASELASLKAMQPGSGKGPEPRRMFARRTVRRIYGEGALPLEGPSSRSLTAFLPGADMGEVYRINAGETVEFPIHEVLDTAILSPDGTRFVDFAPAPDDRGTAGISNADGSGYHVLPLPDLTLNLPHGVWLAGGTRIATTGWGLE